MDLSYRLLEANDARVLDHVAEDVFDGPVDPRWTAAFLADPRHHIVVALDGALVVGMVTAIDHVHPDKAPQLWINELGVAPPYRRRGIATKLLRIVFEHGRRLGCTQAWVGTETFNEEARGLYESLGAPPEPCVFYTYSL